MRKINKLLIFVCILALATTFTDVTAVAATQTENIMLNGDVETPGCIGSVIENNWIGLLAGSAYGYAGQDTGAAAVMTQDTEIVHNMNASTKSLKSVQTKLTHYGSQHDYYVGYRFSSSKSKYLDREMLLEGYVYSTTQDNKISVNFQLSDGYGPRDNYVAVSGVIADQSLTSGAWTKISVRFLITASYADIDRTPNGIGDAFDESNRISLSKNLSEIPADYMDIEFRTNAGETVYYDNFSVSIAKNVESEEDVNVMENITEDLSKMIDVAPNMAIENESVIDKTGWGNTSVFYYHGGYSYGLERKGVSNGLNAVFDTSVKHEGRGSTASMKYPGDLQATPMYRFFDNAKYVGQELIMDGYIYSPVANTFSLSFNIMKSDYSTIYSNKLLHGIVLKAGEWTRISLRFKFTSEGLFYGENLAKKAVFTTDSGAPVDYSDQIYINASFMTEAGTDVWFDDFGLYTAPVSICGTYVGMWDDRPAGFDGKCLITFSEISSFINPESIEYGIVVTYNGRDYDFVATVPAVNNKFGIALFGMSSGDYEIRSYVRNDTLTMYSDKVNEAYTA